MQPSTLGRRCHERRRLSRWSSRLTLKAYTRDHMDRVFDYQHAIFSRAQTDYDARSRNATRLEGDREADQTPSHHSRLDEKETIRRLQIIQGRREGSAGKKLPFSKDPSRDTLDNFGNRNPPRASTNSPLTHQIPIFSKNTRFQANK